MTCLGDMLKRYEYFGKNGKEFTDYFYWDSDYCPKWQLKTYKLRNDYK